MSHSVPASLSGFWFDLDPGFCCYVVALKDANGKVMLTQQECYSDNFVGVEESTWCDVKRPFKD